MPSAVALRWIEIDEDAGVLALEFGTPGVFLLAVKRNSPNDPMTGYWMTEQGDMLGHVEPGIA